MLAETMTERLRGGRPLAWWGLILAGAVIHGLFWAISQPEIVFSDFYKAYFHAAEEVFFNGPRPTWPIEENSTEVGFVNIPGLVWLFVPLVPLGEVAAAWVFLGLGAAAALGAYALLLHVGRIGPRAGAVLLFLFLVNGPLVNSLREGNTTHFILLLLVVALLLWRGGRDFAAGLVLGLCAMIKPPLILFGLYFLLRGRWRVVAGGATTIAAIVAVSLATFGLEINLGWYKACIEPFMKGAIAAFNVQSIDGFLMRLVTGPDELDNWFPLEPSIVHRVARIALVAGLFIGAYWLIRRAGGRAAEARAARGAGARGAGARGLATRDYVEFAIVLVLALVTTPVSWTHYYLLLLLTWGLYLGGQLALPGDAITRRLVWASWVLASLPVVAPPAEPEWLAEILSRTVVSAWLFGGFLMLAALARGAFASARMPVVAAAAKG
jgi:alpha-1,2-mannosyltransferase